MTIAFARFGCLLGTTFIFGIIILIMDFSAGISAAIGGNAARLLGDYHDNIAIRLLTIYDDYYSDNENSIPSFKGLDVSQLIAAVFQVGIGFLLLFIIFGLVYVYIISAFEGAMVHAIAKSHTDHAISMNLDSDNTSKIVIYHILFHGARIAANLTIIALPAFFVGPKALILFYILYYILYAVIACIMIAAIPAIVVEKTSAIDAFKRSYSLCTSSLCFIFGSYVCFILFEIVIALALFALVTSSSSGLVVFLGGLLLLIASLMIFPLSTIMEVTLYLNIRVQSESLNLDQLEEELGLTHSAANAVQLSHVVKRDSDYDRCGQDEALDATLV